MTTSLSTWLKRKVSQMTELPSHYAPWQRTEQEDTAMQNAMSKASPEQMAGFIDALLEEADRQAESKAKSE
jgi:hypothetical protein